MNYLLDTHILLWSLSQPHKLPVLHRQIIEDINNRIFVSYFSYIELSIKLKLGKLEDFKTDMNELIAHTEKAGFMNLHINITHINNYQNLPLMPDHRDPFDRFIISTAIVENCKLLTVDSKFQLYKDYVEII